MLELSLHGFFIFLLLLVHFFDLFFSHAELVHQCLDFSNVIVFGRHFLKSLALLRLYPLQSFDLTDQLLVPLLCLLKGVFVLHQLFKPDLGIYTVTQRCIVFLKVCNHLVLVLDLLILNS